jgi:hypothetical protein
MEEVINDPASCQVFDRGLRTTWTTFVGEIPLGHVVERACTTDGCVNPAHLRLKQVIDYRDDETQRYVSRPRKIDSDEVKVLKREFEEMFHLPPNRKQRRRKHKPITTRVWFQQKAKQLGVGHATVRRVVYNLSWRGERGITDV